ncbi:hypothetical protein EVAR_89969_1 [Eumeta japonica]|uniref:Uncharacterized protein n=1 Tax=Eumeta variegata TaxID=151549 RepID=A0A4C2AAY7_EUMVA|nr:hypothetical protein EVAR_89969_1 [Eumeta japonica]
MAEDWDEERMVGNYITSGCVGRLSWLVEPDYHPHPATWVMDVSGSWARYTMRISWVGRTPTVCRVRACLAPDYVADKVASSAKKKKPEEEELLGSGVRICGVQALLRESCY